MDKPFSAYSGEQPYVFVCYAHEDESIVYPEISWLRDKGINIWYDEGISAGKIWRRELAQAIQGSFKLLYYISGASLRSVHCNREIEYALDRSIEVVPVYLDETELTPELDLALNRVQALYRSQNSNYLERLLNALGQSPIATDQQQLVTPRQSGRRITQSVGVGFMVVLLGIAVWWYWPRINEVPEPGGRAYDSSATTEEALSEISVAVLPFTNMSTDPEQEFFSDGIAEDVLNELAKNAALTVRPRSSSFAFKNTDLDLQAIGQRLRVTHVLEGSVRRSGERIRISTQLSEVGNNRTIWSERYDRELTDVFAVQDAVVVEILSALNVQFGGAPSGRYIPGIEAYEAFLLGRDYYLRNQVEQSEKWLKTAVGLDPSYADAWAVRALNLGWFIAAGFAPPDSGVHATKAQLFNRTALDLDPANTNALASSALSMFYRDRSYEAAVNELVRLVTVHPNNETAHLYLCYVLTAIGRLDITSKVAVKLAALSPESMGAQMPRISVLIQSGSFDEARSAVEEFEGRFGHPLMSIIFSIATADVEKLQNVLEQAPSHWAPWQPFYLALVPYLKGDYQKAREIILPLKRVQGYQSYLQRSYVALVERDLDAAFAYYYKAVSAAESLAIQQIQPRAEWRQAFPEFYADPRYAQLLGDFRLDPESVAKMQLDELPF